jgi:hypothetical protein
VFEHVLIFPAASIACAVNCVVELAVTLIAILIAVPLPLNVLVVAIGPEQLEDL